jgi:hypothetical protein
MSYVRRFPDHDEYRGWAAEVLAEMEQDEGGKHAGIETPATALRGPALRAELDRVLAERRRGHR